MLQHVKHAAIVGLGSIGRRHLRILRKLRPELEITLVRSGLGGEYSEVQSADRVVYSLADAISSGIQAAILSSPSTEHIKQAVELARAGIHILVEKPLSDSATGTGELIKLVREASIVGLTGYVFRYDPGAQEFREMLQKDSIGKPLHVRVECGSYLPDWRPEQDYRETVSASEEMGGGVLLELSHEIDYIRWFFGDIKVENSYLFNSGFLGLQVEESADLLFSSDNGMPISLHLDFHRRVPTRRCTAYTTKGTLTWDVMRQKVSWQAAGHPPQVKSFDYARDHIYEKQILHFLDCIENGTTPAISLEDGAAVLQLIDAARRLHIGSGVVTL
jgi:predicted dehydrogenase